MSKSDLVCKSDLIELSGRVSMRTVSIAQNCPEVPKRGIGHKRVTPKLLEAAEHAEFEDAEMRAVIWVSSSRRTTDSKDAETDGKLPLGVLDAEGDLQPLPLPSQVDEAEEAATKVYATNHGEREVVLTLACPGVSSRMMWLMPECCQ